MMDKKRIEEIKKQFDIIVHRVEHDKIEFWYARELMSLLGYERWEKIFNLKQMPQTINFLSENNLLAYDDLEKKHKL